MRRALACAAVALALALAGQGPAAAAGEEPAAHPWSFNGIFGSFDRGALQRGYLVYRDVCAACHSLKYISFRNLVEIGFSADEAKAIASEYDVTDGPDAEGEMFDRPARLSDPFPSPFTNDNEARAANNGALPPDLSLIVKARSGGTVHRSLYVYGEDYVYALLTGYHEPPEGVEVGEGLQYNAYFPGHQIAMAPPLEEDVVEYADGTLATVEQMAGDVVTFLAWAAEPTLEARKRLGFKVMIFLIALTVLFYLAKQKVWRDVH